MHIYIYIYTHTYLYIIHISTALTEGNSGAPTPASLATFEEDACQTSSLRQVVPPGYHYYYYDYHCY